MSRSAYGLDDRFVQLGLVLWIVCVALAELVVWPGERRVQSVVSGGWQGGTCAGSGAGWRPRPGERAS